MSETLPPSVEVVVIGAGAAGLYAAAVAGRRGRDVLVLERNTRPGLKILISGGGRANFTNRRVGPEHYVSANPHFARSALARCPPESFIAQVEAHGIAYHERRHGQLFCDDSAKRITTMLLAECEAAGVRLATGCEIAGVERFDAPAAPGPAPARFALRTNLGPTRCVSLIVATGGLSYAHLGASDFGHRLARQFGLQVVPPRPGLVPLLWNRADARRWGELAGIAVPARVSCAGATFEEAVLFTHGGLSGPAILQASNHWRLGTPLHIDWWPEADLASDWRAAKLAGERRAPRALLAERLPRRLAELLLDDEAAGRPLAQLADADRLRFAAAVKAFLFQPAGDAGWAKAEVTLGGVDTRGLSSRTLEATAVPGLHFIGEVVDVTGALGGFNFQWAWASGLAAGEAV